MDENKIKYIENNKDYGRVYPWKKIMSEVNKLIKPYVGDNYIPNPPWNSCNWFVDNSERSVGKTTQYLLTGMIANKYGARIEYLRVTKDQIRPMNLRSLWDTILDPEFKYIERITDGKYTTIMYDSKYYYYCNKDANGNIDKETRAPEPFMHVECLANIDDIKSNYNCNCADYVLFDEFVRATGVNKEEDFLNLCQILATYRRNRKSMKIVMCANTINPYNHFFHELCISEDIRKLKLGEEKIVNTPLGTSVWIHLVAFDAKVSEKRRFNNLLYFGFLNPKLASINGGTEWAIKNYPHLPRLDKYNNETRRLLFRDAYVKHYDKLLCFEIWVSSTIGLYMYVREMTTEIEYKKHTRIYVLDDAIRDSHERYALGHGDKLDKLILSLFRSHQVYYSYNDIGNLLEDYMKMIKVA